MLLHARFLLLLGGDLGLPEVDEHLLPARSWLAADLVVLVALNIAIIRSTAVELHTHLL